MLYDVIDIVLNKFVERRVPWDVASFYANNPLYQVVPSH
jgi:hypothetical protein